jgi:hypothetical protein
MSEYRNVFDPPPRQTRATAVSLISASLHGDKTATLRLVNATEDESVGGLIHGSLTLYRALVLRLRTPTAKRNCVLVEVRGRWTDQPSPRRAPNKPRDVGTSTRVSIRADEAAISKRTCAASNPVFLGCTSGARGDQQCRDAYGVWRLKNSGANVFQTIKSVATQ